MIEFDNAPNLDSDEVYAFLQTHSQIGDTYPSTQAEVSKELMSTDLEADRLELIVSVPVAEPLTEMSEEPVDANNPGNLTLYTFRRQQVVVLHQENSTHSSTFVTIPVKHRMEFSFRATGWVVAGTPEASKAEFKKALTEFDWQGQTPEELTGQLERIGFSEPDYVIRNHFTITRVMAPAPLDEQRIWLNETMSGKTGTVDGAREGSLNRAGFSVVDGPVSEGRPFTRPSDPRILEDVHAVNVVTALEGLVGTLGVIAEKCVYKPPVIQRRIAELLKFPEFMVRWKTKRIKIWRRFGFNVTYPQLNIRFSSLNLYAFSGTVDIDKTLSSIIESCLISSALQAAVVGVVLENIAVAAAAFKALFWACMERKLTIAITCVVVDLAILTEHKDDWQPV